VFEGFETHRIETAETEIHLVAGGAGPPLLLLHGYPQTHVLWHKLAPALAERFTVVAADLRGYGDSGKPPSDPDHLVYSKRSTANDMVEVMEAMGHRRFFVAGHDRGGRVAHRMALDHAGRIDRLAVLDIVPTYRLFRDTDQDLATAYYHWFFLIQPGGLPEHMIGADPEYFLRQALGRWGGSEGAFTAEAMAEYVRCFSDPATIHASCEDYRAGASIDLRHDEADDGKMVECPTLVLWGARGVMHRMYDVLDTWRERARDVTGRPVDSGHFLPEEAPEETLEALCAFFAA
jgi:haloacetate dehalogenase